MHCLLVTHQPGSLCANIKHLSRSGVDTESPTYLPQAGECGGDPATANIFGGEDTTPGEFPFSVLLGYNNTRLSLKTDASGRRGEEEYPVFVCSGVLINHWYVVTAGHCVTGRVQLTQVRVGTWKVDPEKYGIVKIPGHPDRQVNVHLVLADPIFHNHFWLQKCTLG